MAVAVSLNKGSGRFYNAAIGTIPISFSSLRSNFKEVTTGSVKASQLRRNTNRGTADPVVPNSTENSNISTNSDWKVSQFYGSIKYYDLVQTGTNDNISNTSDYGLNISSQNWNSNLDKNIKKVFYVDGTIGSVSVAKEAAYFNAQSYNFSIELRSGGQILGAGGARNSGTGGNALYAVSTGGGGGSSISIILGDSSTIRGGGGGGARGGDGWTGPNGPCWVTRQYTGSGTGYCEGCRTCPCPNTPVTINGVTYDSRNCKNVTGCPGERGCACAFGWYNGFICTRTKLADRQCSIDDPKNTPGAPGGIGGNGGLGQGYNQTRTDAVTTLNVTNGPTSGTSASCPTYATSGENGKSGGNGGDWAQSGANTTRTDIQTLINAFYVSPSSGYNGSSGGPAGRAIVGSNYTTSGRTDLILGQR